MSKLIPLVYKKSLIAIAVASISACAAMPQSPDADSEGIGGNIVRAGQSVAGVGLSAWHKTTQFLGFRNTDDAQDTNNRSDSELLAQQNMDQAKPSSENGVTLQPASKVQPVIIERAEAPTAKLPLGESTESTDPQQLPNAGEDTVELADSSISGSNSTESAPDNTELVDTQPADEESENQSLFALNQPLSSDAERGEDLIHTVGDDETLWEIAKRTTGNANNWHTLADINDLTQSATVFPGQALIIPADLVKPGYGAATPALEVAAQSQQGIENIESQAPQGLLDNATELAENEELAPEVAAALPEESALPEPGDTTQTVAISTDATPIDLNEGETLWDFAKRTTGDATNWKAIAAQNNFTEKQAVTVRPGQTIFVPRNLIKSNSNSSAAIDTVPDQDQDSQAALPVKQDTQSLSTDIQLADVNLEEPSEAIGSAKANTLKEITDVTRAAATDTLEQATDVTLTATADTLEQATDVTRTATADTLEQATDVTRTAAANTLEQTTDDTVLAAAEPVEEDVEDITLAAADTNELEPAQVVNTAYQSTDAITPSDSAESEALQVVAESESNLDAVRVSGTYYPKAVYNNADFSSSLLMRVSPGTTLQVSRLMGSWIEVETDKGMGYVHQRDIQ